MDQIFGGSSKDKIYGDAAYKLLKNYLPIIITPSSSEEQIFGVPAI